jgi:3-oxoacyl-[acyl-carrier-protein] synthase II
VTGLGVVTPLGRDLAAFWRNLLAGVSGVRTIKIFEPSEFPCRIAAEVPDVVFDCSRPFVPFRHFKLMSRTTKFAVAASDDAMRDAGLSPGSVSPQRIGVVVGTGISEEDFPRQCEIAIRSAKDGGRLDLARFARETMSRQDPLAYLRNLPNTTASHVAIRHDARGPNSSVNTACAAGAQALGDAARVIERGDADVMIAGGADSRIHPNGILRFSLLGALSARNDAPEEASRPFDRDRDGFVMGEGAGMLVLEEYEHARRRGAPIHAELAGFASTADAWGILAAPDDARGAIACMRAALADASLPPEEIDYINAHGTSTPTNDRIETLAIKEVFGPAARRIPVSSIKSMLGHLICAAGAVEFVACVLALRDGMVPPTINLRTRDPECDLDYVPDGGRRAPLCNVLSNSFGFGGQNAALIARSVDGERSGPC